MREKDTKIEQLMLRSKKLADVNESLQADNTNLQASVANLQADNTNLQAKISNRQNAVASLSGGLKQSILSEIELPRTCVGPKGAECQASYSAVLPRLFFHAIFFQQATPEQQDVEAIGDSECIELNCSYCVAFCMHVSQAVLCPPYTLHVAALTCW